MAIVIISSRTNWPEMYKDAHVSGAKNNKV